MIRQLWTLSVHARAFLRRYMPTNILLDAIRTRRGLKWGIPAMLLAVPYLLAASSFTALIANGGPGWLNLLVLFCLWNTMKFIIIGPVSMILLTRVRVQETVERSRARRSVLISHGGDSEYGVMRLVFPEEALIKPMPSMSGSTP